MTPALGAVLVLCCQLTGCASLHEVAAVLSPAGKAEAGEIVSVERETYLMGTLLRAEVSTTGRAAGLAAIETAFARVARLEDLLSTWRDDTELSRLNHAPVGEREPASPEVLALLSEVRRWRDVTGGAFDPGLGSLIDAWDMRGTGRIPSSTELALARAASGLDLFEMDAAGGTLRRTREGSWIDSGAFGKGAALRSAGEALEELGVRSALLDFGGQVLAIGAPPQGASWSAAVAHPSRRQEPVAVIRLTDASASTSGQSERAVDVRGCRLGHILDPRTGVPVPAWGSVTVVAADPLAADALSTGLFVLGPAAALAWAWGHEDVGVLVLVEAGQGVTAGWNGALEERGIELAPGVGRLPTATAHREGRLPTMTGAEGQDVDAERATAGDPTQLSPAKCDPTTQQSTPDSHFTRPDQPDLKERG